jgi:hypothetical protein
MRRKFTNVGRANAKWTESYGMNKAFVAALLQMLCFANAIPSQTKNTSYDTEWHSLQTLLGQIHGVSTSPPANLLSSKYTSGALMGNGDIGVVAGDTSEEQQSFYFGKSDFWGAGAHYEGLRDLSLVEHDRPDCNWGCRVSILSLGRMNISSPAAGSGVHGDYRVDQDILHARVDTTLDLGGAVVHLRSWTADGVNTFVTEISSDRGNGADLPIQVSLTMPVPGSSPVGSFPVTAGAHDGVIWVTRENAATGQEDYKARAAIAVHIVGALGIRTETGPVSANAIFTLKKGAPVWIATVFESDGRMGLDGPATAEIAHAAFVRARNTTRARIGQLEQAHLAWWKQFWLKSYVQVHDRVLEDYYYGALYALGSATRPGKLAPSLFGGFITTEDVAWGGLYFMNYNEEAPFYGAFSSNHAELAEPYIKMVEAQIPWQRNLTAAAGYKGISYERTFSPFTVLAKPPAPVPIALTKQYKNLPSDQKSNATFSFLPAIQYYEYTQSNTFLKTELYPALRQLDAFWRDFAVHNASGKHWEFDHSSAHEGGDDVNPNLDIGFARRVENELIVTSKVLGVDAEMRPVWQSFLDKLSNYPTGIVNGKRVYLIAASIKNPHENHGLFEPGDQPINLEGLVFPGENLSIGGDQQQLQIARDSMMEMNSWSATKGPNSENGFCKIFPIAARIGWPADDLVAKFKAAILYGWRQSNLTVFQDGGCLETSGSIEALDSMLLQHEYGILRVFPDWPSSMDASFTRLRAKGAFLISSEQRGGKVLYVDIFSEHGGPLTIQNPWGAQRVYLNSGHLELKSNGAGQITLRTTRGKDYLLTVK